MELDYFKTACAVCGRDGMGVHFGVETCRACAAFFKRSEVKKDKYNCYLKTGSCDIAKSKCKYCRLQKCQLAGMSWKKPSGKAEDLVIYRPTAAEREEVFMYCVWNPITQKRVKWVNVEPMLKRSQNIMKSFDLPTDVSFQNLSQLEKLAFSLRKLRSTQSKSPKFTKFMVFEEYFVLWEQHMTRAAEFMMHCEEFRTLPTHEKFAFFKIIWATWRRVERNSMGAAVFGWRCLEQKILLISDNEATKLDEFRMDVSEICDNGFGQFNRMMQKNLFQYSDAVAKPCIEWKFDDVEISFIICQIVWNYAGRKLNGQSQAAADVFLERISNDLHTFYSENQKTFNYAGRLSVIMDVVNNVLKIQMEHEKAMEMAFLFDMFSIQLSDPQLFSY